MRYADQYKKVEEENQALKVEIKDLKTNIKINKEIIEGYFMSTKGDSSTYINKLKDEISLLNKRNEQLQHQNNKYREKIVYYEQIFNESILKYRDKTDHLDNKIFLLNNIIQKKDNIIKNFEIKYEKLFEERDSSFDKEIYVIL